MIHLIGIKHDVRIEIREKLSIIQKRIPETLKKLMGLCSESVILSTCNRMEVYFGENQDMTEKIFSCLGWGENLKPYIFHLEGEEAAQHLMEVVCGFDSIIFGEDQILGQVKDAFEVSLTHGAVRGDLLRLFQTAVTCGKEFRNICELYKFPVSSASMVIREAQKRGIKRFMVLGFGDVGKLAAKYIVEDDFEKLYICVRDMNSVNITNEKVDIIPFDKRKNLYSDVECIISCTSAPHTVVNRCDLPDRELLIFDMAVPRDVDLEVYSMSNVEVFDIDSIGSIKDENFLKRKDVMFKNKNILHNYRREFLEWQEMKEVLPYVRRMKEYGQCVYSQRLHTFKTKKYTKDNEKLAEMLLKSTADAFINRAIEVLKEEHLKGRGEECLRVMERIFMPKDQAL